MANSGRSLCKHCGEEIIPCWLGHVSEFCNGFLHKNNYHNCQNGDGTTRAEPISGEASRDREWLLKRVEGEDRHIVAAGGTEESAGPRFEQATINLRLKWDSSADVLYLGIGGTPQRQVYDDSSGDVIRYEKDSMVPSGATIISFCERAAEEEISLSWPRAVTAAVPSLTPRCSECNDQPALFIRSEYVCGSCGKSFAKYLDGSGGEIGAQETGRES